MSQPTADTIFFLGAGASSNAGVPTTYEMVSRFRDSLNSDQREKLDRIIHGLEEWLVRAGSVERRVDIELLLECIERLDNWKQEILLTFLEPADDIEGWPIR